MDIDKPSQSSADEEPSQQPPNTGKTGQRIAPSRNNTQRANKRAKPGNKARFTTGPIMSHILIMTGTSAIGLMAIFTVDIANLFFLSQLNDIEILAALGYASSILFFTVSIGIGLSIAAVALVSPAIGAGAMTRARRLIVNAHLATFIVSVVIALLLFPIIPFLVELLGATGRTKALAVSYLRIVVPFMPMLAVGICSAAVLRSLGDASRSMYVTLSGAIIAVLLDPLFIFTLGLGLEGAAMVAAISRCLIMIVGLWGVIHVHGAMGRVRLRPFISDMPAITWIAIPAIATNVATPVANAYITAVISSFGDNAVAGWTVIGRLLPIAFGVVFSLSGAIGPIIGQNLGNRNFNRVRATIREALKFTALYALLAWLLMALAADWFVAIFHATGEAGELIIFFCRWLVPMFGFMGALFISNAAFNTLGRPHFSTAFNWGRATLGTIPFVYAGAILAGAKGVLTANFIGGIPFGIAAVWASYKLIDKLAAADAAASDKPAGSKAG